MQRQQLEELIVAHVAELTRRVERRAGWLLSYESVEDLVQGTVVVALKAGGTLEYRGQRAFGKWLHLLARQHLVHRRRHWSAAKRDAGKLLRIAQTTRSSIGSTTSRGVQVRAPGAGPSTLAVYRDELVRAARAMGLLHTRDQSLLEWTADGLPIAEMAARLKISYDAAARARQRALARFEGVFELLARGSLDRASAANPKLTPDAADVSTRSAEPT